jgi:hypothetical protein
MPTATSFDPSVAHRHFAGSCFNLAWTYIEKPTRTADEAEAMILAAMASLWHWTQRPDCTDQHRSIGHWQISRAFALSDDGVSARRHAERCLSFADSLGPFFQAYAHEALARAAACLGDKAGFDQAMAAAEALLPKIPDAADQQALRQDLASIRP